jgi:AbrB family looped-hinge helix DNA binding protein
MVTKMTVKGQVLVPKAIRDKTGITPGARVAWDIDEQGRAVLTPLSNLEERLRRDSFRSFVDQARRLTAKNDAVPNLSTDEVMALSRDPLP